MAANLGNAKVLGVLSVLGLLTSVNVEAAYTSTPGTVSGCIGGSASFTWVYDNPGDASSIIWNFGSVNVLNYQPSTDTTVQGAAQFSGRVTHNGNGSIILDHLRANDAGSYTCTVTYNSNPTAVDSATLTVNAAFTDSISTVLTITGCTATVNLGSQNGVVVEWKNTAGEVVTGTTFTGEGTFTVCLTGCVSGSATACQQVELGPPCDTTCIIIICVVVIYVLGIVAVLIVLAIVKKFPHPCPRQQEYTGIGCRAKCVIIATSLGMGIIVAVVILIVLGKEKKLPCCKGSQHKKPDSGNSGTPRTKSGNATNQGNKTKDPSPKTDDKERREKLPPLTNATNVSVEDGKSTKTDDKERREKLPPLTNATNVSVEDGKSPKTDDKKRHEKLSPLTNATNVSVEDGKSPKTDDKERREKLPPLTNATNVSVEDGKSDLNTKQKLADIPSKKSL